MTPSGAAHSQLRYSACGAAEAAEETRGRWLSGPAGAGLLAVLLAGCGPSGAQSADVGVAELPGRVAVDVVQQLVGFPLELEPLLVYLARRLRFWCTRCSVPPAAMLAAMSLVTLV